MLYFFWNTERVSRLWLKRCGSSLFFLFKKVFVRLPCYEPHVYVYGCLCDNWNPAFCLFLELTGLHFREEWQHGGDECQQKIKCRPIITREICEVSLSDVLYANTFFKSHLLCNRFSLTVIRLGLEDSFFGGGAKQGQFYPPPSCFKKK